MKRALAVLITSMLLAAVVFAEDEPSRTFRQTVWGMGIEEVKSVEESELASETDDSLLYKAKVVGLAADLVYSFTDGKLNAASYNIFLEPADCITTYYFLRELLSMKYGKPGIDAGWDDILISAWETQATRTVLLYGGKQAGLLRLAYAAKQAAAAFSSEL
ncbi:MAG: hypothetical protein ACM3ZC_10010 [Bacteroidota bacterium]